MPRSGGGGDGRTELVVTDEAGTDGFGLVLELVKRRWRVGGWCQLAHGRVSEASGEERREGSSREMEGGWKRR